MAGRVMTKSLGNRLVALEGRLRPRQEIYLGSFEIHHTGAWPGCEGKPGSEDLEPCTEHGPSCRKSVTPLRAPIRRSIVLAAPWVQLG
jgi:hypothetical protein